MIVLTGAQETRNLGRDAWHGTGQAGLLKPIDKWRARAVRADAPPRTMRMAIHQATHGQPGPVRVDVPKDLPKQVLADQAVAELASGEATGLVAAPRPEPGAFARTIDLLHRTERPIIQADGEACWAGAEHAVWALAESAGIPVTTGAKARGLLPEDHPFSLGPVGHIGLKAGCDALADADFVLTLESRLSDRTTVNWMLVGDQTSVVQVDAAPTDFGRQNLGTLAALADNRVFFEDLLEVTPVDSLPARPADGDSRGKRFQDQGWSEVDAIPENAVGRQSSSNASRAT